MSSSILLVATVLTLGGGPYGCQSCNNGGFATAQYGGGYYPSGGMGGGVYSTGMGLNSYSGSNNDTLLPWDSQEAWMHGYFQEISPYSGFHYFRPYNYKHVLSQVDLSYRWGNAQGMPYSHQWWHRYHMKASVSPALHQPVTQWPATATQTASTYESELARLRAWRDFQAEQRPVSAPASYQNANSSGSMPASVGSYDPATQAAFEQATGSRGYAGSTVPVGSFPRSNEPPMIQEFVPQYAPTGPSFR